MYVYWIKLYSNHQLLKTKVKKQLTCAVLIFFFFLHFLICTFGEVAMFFNHFFTSAGGHAWVGTAACFLLNVRTSTALIKSIQCLSRPQ